jgi:Zn-dependent protease
MLMNWIGDQNRTLMSLVPVLIVMATLLICATVHELSHGAAALMLGDQTAKRMGRLTFNPLKHLDPIGTLMIALVGFGFFKPVPVNFMNLKNPKLDMVMVAIAGPISNILFAFLLLCVRIPFMTGTNTYVSEAFWFTWYVSPNQVTNIINEVLMLCIHMNIGLAIFNLLPIPPLDGFKIVGSFMPDNLYYRLLAYERFGFIVLIGLMYIPGALNWLGGARDTVIGALARVFLAPSNWVYGW